MYLVYSSSKAYASSASTVSQTPYPAQSVYNYISIILLHSVSVVKLKRFMRENTLFYLPHMPQ